MKKMMFAFSMWFLCGAPNISAQNVDHIRTNYHKATTDRTICSALLNDLENDGMSPLEMAYLGALQTIWAKFVNNPFSKLKSFNKGKKNIETAVEEAPNNAEIRYLRLSIQKNVPAFLGYNQDIEKDRLFLEIHLSEVPSESLKRQINELIKT